MFGHKQVCHRKPCQTCTATLPLLLLLEQGADDTGASAQSERLTKTTKTHPAGLEAVGAYRRYWDRRSRHHIDRNALYSTQVRLAVMIPV